LRLFNNVAASKLTPVVSFGFADRRLILEMDLRHASGAF
jgi:hypothetical protein